MAVVLSNVVVNSGALFRGRGDVKVWTDRVTDRFGNEARKYAPSRTGELRSKITTSTKTVGPRQVEGLIASRAKHTMYVLRGTTGPIMSDVVWAAGALDALRRDPNTGFYPAGTFMPLPAHAGFAARLALTVDGQKANNFLERAWRGTARDHRALRGKAVPSFILSP